MEALLCLFKPLRLKGPSTLTGGAAEESSIFTVAVSAAGARPWLDEPSSSLWLLLAVHSAGCQILDSGSFQTYRSSWHEEEKGRQCIHQQTCLATLQQPLQISLYGNSNRKVGQMMGSPLNEPLRSR